ncbi:phenylacetate-CoA ligase [Eubacterium ruminantium]|nr:phenylacetate-CoA ligase [Eubacterium ruminantium]
MSILEFARNKAFWILDKIRGRVVHNELSLLNRVEKMSEQELSSYSEEALKELLGHAAGTTAFYAPFAEKDFDQWPVINKDNLKSTPDEFLSCKYKKDNLVAMSTSGSTGTPLTVYHDVLKKKATYAEVLHYNGKVGYEIGKKIIYLRSIVSEVSKSRLQQFFQNINLIDCYDLSDEGIERKLEQITRLTKHSQAVMMGYASTLDAFRDYFSRKGVQRAKGCKLSGIISGSEMLFDETRSMMESAFHCPCVSRYANEEQGFLGQDGFKNNVFLTDRAHFYFEVLKLESNEPAEKGEVGRLVVTDLKNFSMPLIRYDTGDVGKLVSVKIGDKEYQAIDDFGGRRIDMIFNSEGKRISPHAITNAMWKFTDINQYQLIQDGPSTYTLKVNADAQFMRKNDLEMVIRDILGKAASLTVEYVSEIPVLNSGKRRYIVNKM